jgi:hypothetical protein
MRGTAERLAGVLPRFFGGAAGMRSIAAVELFTCEVHTADLARIGDVVERVGVEHEEVGALAGGDRAAIVGRR